MKLEQAASWLAERDNFIILTHARPDGDTLCSAGALVYGLNRLGKTAYMLKNPETTDVYDKYVSRFYPPTDFVPEHVVSVDTARRGMITISAGELADKVELAIDHHGSNSGYAAESCIVPEAAACGEIIFALLTEMGVSIDKNIAGLLYIAISTDTGCFAYTNTTSRTLEIASQLVAAGAENGRLNKELFRTKKKCRVMLESMMMSGLDFFSDGQIAVATLTQKMIADCGADEGALEDIASLPGLIEGVKVGIVLRELENGDSKISCRTVDEVDSNAICGKLGGGGHRCAAGCTISRNVCEAKALIVQAALELL